jgi:hypothetical protein
MTPRERSHSPAEATGREADGMRAMVSSEEEFEELEPGVE